MSEVLTPVGKYPFFNRVTSTVNSMLCYRFKNQHSIEGSVLTADPTPDQCGAVWAVANYEADIERLEKEKAVLQAAANTIANDILTNSFFDGRKKKYQKGDVIFARNLLLQAIEKANNGGES